MPVGQDSAWQGRELQYAKSTMVGERSERSRIMLRVAIGLTKDADRQRMGGCVKLSVSATGAES